MRDTTVTSFRQSASLVPVLPLHVLFLVITNFIASWASIGSQGSAFRHLHI